MYWSDFDDRVRIFDAVEDVFASVQSRCIPLIICGID